MRSSSGFIIALTMLTLTACVTTSPKEMQRQQKLAHLHYQIGVDALGKGLLPKAFEELIASNKMRPHQPEVLDAIAYAWLLRSDLKKSEHYYKKALHYGAGSATQNNYANLLNKQQRYPEAEKAARIALNDPRYPNQELALVNLGNALIGQKRYADAITAMKQAVQFNPDSNLARIRLADSYAFAGQKEEAKALFASILQTEPDNRAAVEGLVQILIQQQQQHAAYNKLYQLSQHSKSITDRAWALKRMEALKHE